MGGAVSNPEPTLPRGRTLRGSLADAAALSHRHTPRHLGVGGRRKRGPGWGERQGRVLEELEARQPAPH